MVVIKGIKVLMGERKGKIAMSKKGRIRENYMRDAPQHAWYAPPQSPRKDPYDSKEWKESNQERTGTREAGTKKHLTTNGVTITGPDPPAKKVVVIAVVTQGQLPQ